MLQYMTECEENLYAFTELFVHCWQESKYLSSRVAWLTTSLYRGIYKQSLRFPLYLLFEQLCHLQVEPPSRCQICVQCGAYALKFSLNCTPISLNTLYVSETS